MRTLASATARRPAVAHVFAFADGLSPRDEGAGHLLRLGGLRMHYASKLALIYPAHALDELSQISGVSKVSGPPKNISLITLAMSPANTIYPAEAARLPKNH